MKNCKFCNKRNRGGHQEKCWLNPTNMHFVLSLLAQQMIEKSSFNHLHYGIHIKPINAALKKKGLTSLKTILKRIGLENASSEEKILGFVKYTMANGLWEIDAFPPPLLYVLDGWHCYKTREEGQWRIDFALQVENKLLGYE